MYGLSQGEEKLQRYATEPREQWKVRLGLPALEGVAGAVLGGVLGAYNPEIGAKTTALFGALAGVLAGYVHGDITHKSLMASAEAHGYAGPQELYDTYQEVTDWSPARLEAGAAEAKRRYKKQVPYKVRRVLKALLSHPEHVALLRALDHQAHPHHQWVKDRHLDLHRVLMSTERKLRSAAANKIKGTRAYRRIMAALDEALANFGAYGTYQLPYPLAR
jgi:hypothetical protein